VLFSVMSLVNSNSGIP